MDVITRQFIDVIVMKVLARQQGISKVSSYGENVFIEFIEDGKERVVLKSRSKDDDDIIATPLQLLNKYKIVPNLQPSVCMPLSCDQ